MRRMKTENFLAVNGNSAALYLALAAVVGTLIFMVVACAWSIN